VNFLKQVAISRKLETMFDILKKEKSKHEMVSNGNEGDGFLIHFCS